MMNTPQTSPLEEVSDAQELLEWRDLQDAQIVALADVWDNAEDDCWNDLPGIESQPDDSGCRELPCGMAHAGIHETALGTVKEGTTFRLETEQATGRAVPQLQQVQAMMKGVGNPGDCWSDELIADRRAEAARE